MFDDETEVVGAAEGAEAPVEAPAQPEAEEAE